MKIEIRGHDLYLVLHVHAHGTSYHHFAVLEGQTPSTKDFEHLVEDFDPSDEHLEVYGPIDISDVVVVGDITETPAERNARRDYRAFLGQEIVVGDLFTAAGDFDDLPGKFRIRVCRTGDDDITRAVDEYIDPIWNVELLEVLEGDQKTAWRAENIHYHAPSYMRDTGVFASAGDLDQHERLTAQLKKEVK